MDIARKVIILVYGCTAPPVVFTTRAMELAMGEGYRLVNKYTGDSVKVL